jgi:hypothetical protein
MESQNVTLDLGLHKEHAEYRVARQAIYEKVHELNKRLDIVASDATPKLSDVPRLCRELMSRLSIRSTTNSLRNHIFLIWVYLSVPMFFFAALTYQDAPLTLIRILWVLSVCTCAGVILAFVGWYVIVPSIRRRSTRK